MASQSFSVPADDSSFATNPLRAEWNPSLGDVANIDSAFRNSVPSYITFIRMLRGADTSTHNTYLGIARASGSGRPVLISSFVASGLVRFTVGSARAIFTLRNRTAGTSAASYHLDAQSATDRAAVYDAAIALGAGSAPLTVEFSDAAFPTGLAGFHVASTAVTKAYIGASEITKAYVGSSELG